MIHTTSANRFVGGLRLEKSETAEKVYFLYQHKSTKKYLLDQHKRTKAQILTQLGDQKGDATQKGASKVPVANKALKPEVPVANKARRSEAVPVLGAEELGGDDESVASKALSNGRGRWDQIVEEDDGSHKLSKLLATPTAAG